MFVNRLFKSACRISDYFLYLALMVISSCSVMNSVNMLILLHILLSMVSLNIFQDVSTVHAVDLPVMTFLPSDDDYDVLRARMIVVAMRMLRTHLTYCVEAEVEDHIEHEYSEQMSQKSELVNLGLFNANPSSNEGVTAIMGHLQEYCPQSEDNVIPILCNGDGLSIERMRTSKEKRCRTPTHLSRLEGIVPSPQEFHAEALFTQVSVHKRNCIIVTM